MLNLKGDNMKQSEKDEILKQVNKKSSILTYRGLSVSDPMITVKEIEEILNGIILEPDEITEVYAIQDYITGNVIWNAHGCPYKYKADAQKKINSLLETDGIKAFGLLTFKLDKSL
jgi:hypothetical protein